MKPASSTSPLTSNQPMLHNHQNNSRKAKNKRRQRQHGRRKHNRNLFSNKQNTYPIFQNEDHFLWRRANIWEQPVKRITVVAGSSMASHLIEHNLQTTKDIVKLTYESGCNCARMLNWLSSFEGRQFMHRAGRLILILGTNDLHTVGAEETVHRVRETVESIRLLYPGIQIIWQLLQWRMKPTRYLSCGTEVLREIAKCNMMLLELARRLNFQIVDPALTRHHICHDNLHPTNSGSRLIENSIRSFLEYQ
jgi:hypothetical protein